MNHDDTYKGHEEQETQDEMHMQHSLEPSC
jgi:hypothetical protein